MDELSFESQEDWSAWLDENHAASAGVWLRIAKTASGVESVSYAEALEEALRFGWIDGQKKSLDESAWLQKFTPRGERSLWSRVNREKAEKLIRGGRMKPAGLQAVERAKQNGRWEAAYNSPGRASVPVDFQAALEANPAAKAFFATLNSANRYAILWRLQTAKKPETRAKRIEHFIGMLERNEKLHP